MTASDKQTRPDPVKAFALVNEHPTPLYPGHTPKLNPSPAEERVALEEMGQFKWAF